MSAVAAHRSGRFRSRRLRQDRGAAAVEFALVVLPLMLLVMGILEFGWIFNQQVSLSNAARESARYYAIHQSQTFSAADCTGATTWTACAQSVGKKAAPTIASSAWTGTGNGIVVNSSCSASGGFVTVTATIDTPELTGMFSGMLPAKMTGKGKTVCGG